eukprot:jgi/Botrbrau1/14796/Bobra.105_1s0009.1
MSENVDNVTVGVESAMPMLRLSGPEKGPLKGQDIASTKSDALNIMVDASTKALSKLWPGNEVSTGKVDRAEQELFSTQSETSSEGKLRAYRPELIPWRKDEEFPGRNRLYSDSKEIQVSKRLVPTNPDEVKLCLSELLECVSVFREQGIPLDQTSAEDMARTLTDNQKKCIECKEHELKETAARADDLILAIANSMKGKTPDEIRKLFNLPVSSPQKIILVLKVYALE